MEEGLPSTHQNEDFSTPPRLLTPTGSSTPTSLDPVSSYQAWRKRKEHSETPDFTPSSVSSTSSSVPVAGETCQQQIKEFLKEHSSYDVLPVSFRLIVLDTSLLVKKALSALMQNGVVSAPLWDSKKHKFAGVLTVSDFINLIQYYYTHSSWTRALEEIEKFQIWQLRDMEQKIGAPPPQMLFIHPMRSLYDACRLLVESRAHRLPLLDTDPDSGQEMIVSVLTQYRILKFIAMNFKGTRYLKQPLSQLRIGTYENIATAQMSTPVIEVINMLAERGISSVPIVDEDNVVINVYEALDVMIIARSGAYHDLNTPVGEALKRRSEDFPGVHTCTLNDTLQSIFATVRKAQVHRLIVVDQGNHLCGIVSLSDILRYLTGP
ncbi:uncharacterized protein VTP21DRAFT_3925 [Calcarisporiella thermophila]|uniref:uncharacterized protein n=1 Tax=Calcarisporiella thermophila TaxID=911321 RepID=UPI0037424F52